MEGLSLTSHLSDFDTSALFSKVLLVEDDRAHAELIKRALKSHVGEIIHVDSGKEAIESIQSNYTELVFCDLNLGDLSGLEVLQTVRELRPHLPVIMLTSSNNIDDAVAAMREGAWDYMVKSISEDFDQRIAFLIEQTAERQIEHLRSLKLQTERDAFWIAAHAAQDGLAILDSNANIVFSNEAFNNFCNLAVHQDSNSRLNIVNIVAEQDYTVAQALREELNTNSTDTLWSSELKVTPAFHSAGASDHYFMISLISGGMGDLQSLGDVSSLNKLPKFRRNVVWVRDVTRAKDREKFQRDLLSTTTHDLKGPLGAILNCSELLAADSGIDKKKGQELVTRIASCARNAISIIDELLSARRIQDGVLVVRPRWYEVVEIVEDAYYDYMPVARAKSIEFSHRLSQGDIKVFADRMSLHRVLGNLISNAIKFTEKGGKVELFAERVGNEVKFSVNDTGSGIESHLLHRLFERYSRLEKHQEVEGSGLGLYVVKNIVEAHGGYIEVKSELGVGTTFIVVIPDQEPQPTA